MNRISTSVIYSHMVDSLAYAQRRQQEAGDQVTSEKKATDLKGFSSNAQTLVGMQSVRNRLTGLIDQGQLTSNRLQVQEVALSRLEDSSKGARTAIADSLASGRGDGLMQQLRGYFSDTVTALNTKHDGKFLFAGGAVDTAPVSATTMSDLTSGPAISDFFQNDKFIVSNRLDETTSIDSGMLADDLGTGALTVFQSIQAYVDANGPFDAVLTDAQRSFLEGVLPQLDTETDNFIDANASNGLMRRRAEDVSNDLQSRQDTLDGLIGNLTNVDMAEAITRLQQAQLSLQATAQVFSTLQGSSLLALLK